jgi:hypothetical protein
MMTRGESNQCERTVRGLIESRRLFNSNKDLDVVEGELVEGEVIYDEVVDGSEFCLSTLVSLDDRYP